MLMNTEVKTRNDGYVLQTIFINIISKVRLNVCPVQRVFFISFVQIVGQKTWNV